MSSTNKTDNLGLSRWNGSDTPQMSDFLMDNLLVDSAFGDHKNDTDIHITSAERKKWNAPYYMGTYMGNGEISRTVETGADFSANWGIVFAVDTLTGINDFQNKVNYVYFALVSSKGSTPGASISGSSLTVAQATVPVSGNGYKRLNESGVTYIYILFR